jgi:hypothetical protein
VPNCSPRLARQSKTYPGETDCPEARCGSTRARQSGKHSPELTCAQTHPIAYTSLQVDLHASRDEAARLASNIDLREIHARLHIVSDQSDVACALRTHAVKLHRIVCVRELWVRRTSAVVRGHEHTRGAYTSLVESMLRNEHIPEGLSDLVSGL